MNESCSSRVSASVKTAKHQLVAVSISKNDAEQLKYLLSNFPQLLEYKESVFGRTWLHQAAALGYLECVVVITYSLIYFVTGL